MTAQSKSKAKQSPAEKPVSLRPLKFEQAVEKLLKSPPQHESAKKKASLKRGKRP